MIDEQQIEDVLSRANIVDVIASYVDLKRKGINYESCCPFHSEKTPSFIVNANRGTYFCYGECQEGGNAIRFVMKYENISFPEAVKKLAHKYGIVIDNKNEPITAEQEQLNMKKEAMLVINAKVQEYYVSNLSEKNEKAAFAKDYIIKRWGKKFPLEMGIGYASDKWDGLYQYATKEGFSIQLMLEMGLLKKNKNDQIFDFYRGRVVIPIKDRFRRTIAFTARDITGVADTAKYLNSNVSAIYSKENTIFGIDVALRQGVKEDKFYLVEGAPDVLRLQSINVNNTIASLGASWTKKHFDQINKFVTKLCFIPDADIPKNGEVFGAGIKAVCKNGISAMQEGFSVTVKELPCGNDKNDPDSYITSKYILDEIHEEDFIIWYAQKIFENKTTTEDLSRGVAEISGLIASIKDDVKESMYLQKLQGLYRNKSLWKIAIDAAKKKNKEHLQNVE